MITLRRTISLIAGMILIIAFLASACAPAATPQVLKETVVVEKEVEKVVTVEVEKEVEKVVTVEVEKVVTATPPPCPSAPAPFDEACIDWKQFSGETISVFLMPNEWQEAVQAKIPQFEDLTGIKVQMEIYPDSELWTKLSVALSAGATTPDVVPLGSFQLGTFVPTGWIEPLDTYLDNPQLTNAAWYDLEDVHKSARDHFTYNGKLYAISFDSSGAFMMYRKDLLEEAGIEVPKDFQELYEAAVALNNPPGVFGISSLGLPLRR
jgi:ABC-type glycerol-3-phosphate transport system substrate-binding protein